MGVWMDGWGGRQFLGRWAADRVGCKGGYGGTRGGPSRASIDKVSRKEKKKKEEEAGCRANNNGRSCDASARAQANKACIFQALLFSNVPGFVGWQGKRERGKERQREQAKMTSLIRIKVPMLQAAHAITTCRRVDFLEGGGGLRLCAPTRPNSPSPGLQYSGICLSPPQMFFPAGPHCTLPFPELKAGELGRTGRCGARSGPADESEPRPRPLRTTYTVGTMTVFALSATPRPLAAPTPESRVSTA